MNASQILNWQRWVLILTICFSFGSFALGEAAPLVPLRDFFRNPEVASLTLSPDGVHLAYMAPVERRLNLFVQKRGEATARQVTDVRDRDIGGYFWKGNDRLIYLKDDGGDENYHLFAVNLTSGKTQVLVVDSDPARELEEARAKARGMLRALGVAA